MKKHTKKVGDPLSAFPETGEEGYVPLPSPEEEEYKRSAYKRIKRGRIPKEGAFDHFTPDLAEGLSCVQVKKRFSQLLFNYTEKRYSKSYFGIFISNICTYFNLLALLVAIALIYAQAPLSQYAFALMFVLNTTTCIVQEIHAKKQIDKLTLVSLPTAKVIRSGMKQEIPVGDVVVDDVILLETGMQIPVDATLGNGNVEVNESLLTGEAVPVKKNIGDPLYAGSYIVGGNCVARVHTVGKRTYANQLTAKAAKYKRPHSEIMHSINLFITIISVLMIPIVVGFIWLNMTKTFASVPEFIQNTAGVIIGMIPSGMILLTSIAMATGIIRLAQNHTLVNDMYSLEMLARVDVLCLDKTGTITDGRMKVENITVLNTYTEYSVDDVMGAMLTALDDNNPTSMAMKARFTNGNPDLIPKAIIPFTSKRKLSAVSFAGVGTFVYGAPEFVLRPMSARVEKLVNEYSSQGLRVLVLAYSSAAIAKDRLPSILRPMAIITLSDNIRADAADTIRWFRENGVQVKVISGDNPLTVSEVAKRAGVENAENYISLEGLSEPEVIGAASLYTVFGRVSPEQKATLVKALKKERHTVAMTGDGVNDILAMKEADCAVSVASGSEAARNVSNLVLMDNNFSNMPKVVHEGRQVINNVKNSSSLYIMKTLFTAILAIICIALGKNYLFKTNNMLAFELLITGIPSIIFSQQPNNQRLTGKFFPYVMCHSIPAALTMVCAAMGLYCASFIQFGEFTPEYYALTVLAITCTGLINLCFIARPFNILRSITCVSAIILVCLVFSWPLTAEIIINGWGQLQFSVTGILFLICIVETSVPLAWLFNQLFGWLEKRIVKNS